MRQNVLLKALVLVSRIRLRDILRGLSLDHGDHARDVLNAFAAQGLAASGWVKDVEIDKSAEAVGTGYRKRCKAEEIAEAKSLTAVLDKK